MLTSWRTQPARHSRGAPFMSVLGEVCHEVCASYLACKMGALQTVRCSPPEGGWSAEGRVPVFGSIEALLGVSLEVRSPHL